MLRVQGEFQAVSSPQIKASPRYETEPGFRVWLRHLQANDVFFAIPGVILEGHAVKWRS